MFSPRLVGHFIPPVHTCNRHKLLGTDAEHQVTESVDLTNNSDGRVTFDDSVDVFDPHTYLAHPVDTGKLLTVSKNPRVFGMERKKRRPNGDNVK